MGTIKIIESNEDNFQFERAFVVEENGALGARAIFGGTLCDIETKKTLLNLGIANCAPVDGTPEDSWPVSVVIEKHQEDADPYQETLWNATANPRIVAAARRFSELLQSGNIQPGMEL